MRAIRQKQTVPSAILRESVASRSNVDLSAGVVYGCRLAEVGELAVFKDLNGDRQEILMTPKLIESLLDACLAEERLSAHWTHGWVMGGADGLASSVATWRNFRKDDGGNLIADAFTWPGVHRDTILHAAENDPKGIMVSMVFDYTGGKDTAVATRVAAADFVETGAATTALCTAVLSALSKTAKLDMPDLTNPPPADPPAAPAPPFTPEQEARINELIQAALNPPAVDDATAPAMFAAIRKEVGVQVTARFSESETKIANLAEASFVRKIGGTAAVKNFTDNAGNDGKTRFKTAVTAQLSAGAPNRGEAIRRVLHDKPELAKFREEV